MACACKVNQEIDKIQKYYSVNGKHDTKKSRMSVNKKDAAITIFIYLMLLPLIPFMILFVIGFTAFSKNKRLSMRNFLGFIHVARYGKKQQII
jgi:hypothetical protein